MTNFLNTDLTTLIIRGLILLIALPTHELAHAFVANYFGDDTPRLNGRLTLNPLAHLDWVGSFLFLFVGFGWARPVPINPYALRRRSPSAVMWVSLAGPLSNLALAILGGLIWRLGVINLYHSNVALLAYVPNFLYDFIALNLILLLFNLIPVAPLDGEKIAEYFFPPSWATTLDRIRPYGPMILIVIAMVLPYFGINLLSWIISPPLNAMMSLLTGI